MIEQLLNRDYVLEIAAAVSEGLRDPDKVTRAAPDEQRRGPVPAEPLAGISHAELAQMGEALSEVRELKPVLTRRRNGRPPKPEREELMKDDLAYIPRDPLLSLVQSAVEEAVETYQPEAIAEPHPPEQHDDRRAGQPLPAVTARTFKDVPLEPGTRAWKRFEVATGGWVWLSDPRWALALAHNLWTKATQDVAKFVAKPQVVKIDNDAQIFLVSDWGTGLDRARRVSDQIATHLRTNPRRQKIVVHLGDVYYSGTDREFEQRFLGCWPVALGDNVLSFTLPGNHDMYSGGHAYFARALRDPRFNRQGGCSYFALENDHWQILGLDSAYEDEGLHGDQAKWARDRIEQRPPGSGTILLSHHQPFSAHSSGVINKVLRNKIGPVLETKRVDAWFWGHEHRCIVYGPEQVGHATLPFSSCIGHGGVPEYLVMQEGMTRPAPWRYEYLKKNSTDLQPWGTFGFAVVDIDGARTKVRYIDENGRQHHTVDDLRRSGP